MLFCNEKVSAAGCCSRCGDDPSILCLWLPAQDGYWCRYCHCLSPQQSSGTLSQSPPGSGLPQLKAQRQKQLLQTGVEPFLNMRAQPHLLQSKPSPQLGPQALEQPSWIKPMSQSEARRQLPPLEVKPAPLLHSQMQAHFTQNSSSEQAKQVEPLQADPLPPPEPLRQEWPEPRPLPPLLLREQPHSLLQPDFSKQRLQVRSVSQLDLQKDLQPPDASPLPQLEPERQSQPPQVRPVPHLRREGQGHADGSCELQSHPVARTQSQASLQPSESPSPDSARGPAANQNAASPSAAAAVPSPPTSPNENLMQHSWTAVGAQSDAARKIGLSIEDKVRGRMVRLSGTEDPWLARNSLECTPALIGVFSKAKGCVRTDKQGRSFTQPHGVTKAITRETSPSLY